MTEELVLDRLEKRILTQANLSNFLMMLFMSNIIMLVVAMEPSSLNFFCNPPFSFSPFSISPTGVVRDYAQWVR
jgi:hypothetical protein